MTAAAASMHPVEWLAGAIPMFPTRKLVEFVAGNKGTPEL